MKLFLCLLLLVSLQAHAQLIVSFSGGNPVSAGPGTAGYEFTEGALPQIIQSLGVWDESGSGLTASHTVGIWDFTTQTLLASATVVPATATDLGGFWYQALAAPLTLQANHSYAIGAQYADVDFDLARANVPTVTTSTSITLGDALLSTSSGFAFPDLNVSLADRGFFGPNASTIAVPEPRRGGLVIGLALVAFLVVTAQSRR